MVKFIILGYSIVLITVFCALKQDNELQQSVARGAVVYAVFVLLVIKETDKESKAHFLHLHNQISY